MELGRLSDILDSCAPLSTVVWEVLAGDWDRMVWFEHEDKEMDQINNKLPCLIFELNQRNLEYYENYLS